MDRSRLVDAEPVLTQFVSRRSAVRRRVAFRKKVYRALDELQVDLDAWLQEYNEQRSHQGRWCYGKTPWQTFLDNVPLAKEKMLAA